MPSLMSDTYTPEELSAYHAGRDAHAAHRSIYDNPHRCDRRDEYARWSAWLQGFEDASDGVSVEFRAQAEANGARL